MKSYRRPSGTWVVSAVIDDRTVTYTIRRRETPTNYFYQLDRTVNRGTTYVGSWPTRHHAITHAKQLLANEQGDAHAQKA